MGFQARGQSGQLRKGMWQVAARLGQWHMDDASVSANVVETDAFWMSEPGGWSLWLTVGRRAMVWRDVDVRDVGGDGHPMTVHVKGSPETRDAPAT